MSHSVRPHRRQPTRLPSPWDSPGKNTRAGCYFLLQCMKVRSESEVAQSFPSLSDPMDCSPPGSSVHEIFQARVLEWGAIAFSHPCMTTGKIIVLTIQTFVGKVMSLLFYICHSFPSKEQASFNFMAAVTVCSDFGAQENWSLFLLFLYLP